MFITLCSNVNFCIQFVLLFDALTTSPSFHYYCELFITLGSVCIMHTLKPSVSRLVMLTALPANGKSLFRLFVYKNSAVNSIVALRRHVYLKCCDVVHDCPTSSISTCSANCCGLKQTDLHFSFAAVQLTFISCPISTRLSSCCCLCQKYEMPTLTAAPQKYSLVPHSILLYVSLIFHELWATLSNTTATTSISGCTVAFVSGP